MKQIIHIVLLLLALLLPATTYAHDFEVDGIYYNILDGNEAAVTHKGDYWTSEPSYFGDVVIPSNVIYKGVTYSVTSIGDRAFCDCSGLSSVIIPNSVTSIGNWAFQCCTGLTGELVIPNSVTSIGNAAFCDCDSLMSILIPDSVSSIGFDAFTRTAWYNTWYNNQPDGMVYIGLVAYIYKGKMPDGTILTLNDGTIGIAGGAFENGDDGSGPYGGLTSIIIPNSVKIIGDYAFRGCIGLTSINLNSVTTIGRSAFEYCSGLTSITIPNSVTTIGTYAFNYCTGLTSVTIGNSVITLDATFSGCSSLTSIIIPNSVKHIESNTFDYCTSLKSISIPNSVTYIGGSAFAYCDSLIDLSIYTLFPPISEEGGWVFYLELGDYSNRTLHVPVGAVEAYQADENWYPYFGQIVEMDLKGDANLDGVFSIADVADTIDYLLGNEVAPFNVAGADLNSNGRVDMGDLTDLIDLLLSN